MPRDKPVLVIRATSRPTEVLLSYGRLAKIIERTSWGPGDRLRCPQD